MKNGFFVVALMVMVLLSALTPAAGQDAVKAEIRQAIDAACLKALWNGPDANAFLAGWDHGAMAPMRLMRTGDLAYVAVAELIAFDLRDNSKPSEKKEFTFLYPVIDVTGDIAMARVEAMRGETIVNTNYFPVVKTKTGWKVVGFPTYLHQKGARPETPAGEADAVKKVVEDTLVRGLLQDGSKDQVLAGVGGPFCDINFYLRELDVVTKLDITPLFDQFSHVRSEGRKLIPPKTSAFTLIGITGHVAAGKLAVTLDTGTVGTMYVVLYKLRTGWAIVHITTDTPLGSMLAEAPPAPKRVQ